ncbi:MAG: Recombination inhibitory protein MutS2 [Myxococcales bacterium]|nr:Recombination inhibitory protein MutS2 [Myxococcales bacterium]
MAHGLFDKTVHDLAWNRLLAELVRRTQSARGAELARALPLYDSLDAARARHEEVSEARALRDLVEPLPFFGPDWGVRSIDEALQRSAKSGALDPQSLRDVALTLAAGARVRQHLVAHRTQAPRLLGRAALITDLDDVSGQILDAFEDGQGTVRLRDRASPALGGLRRNAQRIREELERKLERLLDGTHIAPHLQDRFFTQREDRYVVPIRVDARSQVRGIVHGTSASGQTVFVEPEDLVDLNNRLKLSELEVAEEERRILAELSRLVEEALPSIHTNLDVLAELDLIDAKARLSIDTRATPPELLPLEGTPALDLRRARHPLMILAEAAKDEPRNIVPNDVIVDVGGSLVISGPNAGGKTVALKLSGLIVLMSRAGLHIPAQEGSRVPWFSTVLSDIGDDQSIERDLSTFSAHVLALEAFLASSTRGTLVLLDEVAAGTDPSEGAALAQAVLEALADRGATTIVTTHYDRLKALPTSDDRFMNASVGFDLERLMPTYELHLGVPGASGAIRVARRLGVDAAICARATELAGQGQASLEQLLLDLEVERKRIATERAATEVERAEAQRKHAEAEARAAQAKERLADARRGAHDEAVETLRRARAELDRTATVLRRSGGQVTAANVQEAKRQIDAAARTVHEGAPEPEAPPGRPVTLADLKAGVEVWVRKLGGRASVLGPPKGKQVAVQAGPLKINVALDELSIVEGPSAPKSARSKRGHNAFEVPAPPRAIVRAGHNTLNVRGERVDAAVGMAEKFLDDALRTGQDAVFIIHGHGTGVLRDSLRKQLSSFPGVSQVRPATPEEGGDGTTVIVLA